MKTDRKVSHLPEGWTTFAQVYKPLRALYTYIHNTNDNNNSYNNNNTNDTNITIITYH